MANISTLFLDIGGVLLTNGWDHQSRAMAAKQFNLNFDEMETRHRVNFDTYELGKLSLEDYLDRTYFNEKRAFTRDQFVEFMYAQSQPHSEMIALVCNLKEKYKLKIAVVSNEGRELNLYRIQKFKLNEFVDFFISSSFVRLRKPDVDIYKLALDVSQASVEQIVYIEDQPQFVDVAEHLGIKSIQHTSWKPTSEILAALGLQ